MKILITGAWDSTKAQRDEIKRYGHDTVFLQQEKDEIPCECSEINGVICNGLFLHHNIEKFTNLEYIQLTSAGFDRVPLQYIQEHGIKLHNARGVYSIPMAEFAISGVLALYKKIGFFLENQREHKWEKDRGLLELYGKRVCIVGCGSVGNECAKRFSAFGCKVCGIDLYPRTDDLYEQIEGLEALNEDASKSDVLVLTLPLTEQTYHLIDENVFNAMKEGSVLVNIARGAVVDQSALETALKEKLGGAVLDVFEQEPLNANESLWDMQNVIVTPHNSFLGDGNSKRLFDLIMKNLEEYYENHSSST